MKQLIVFIGVFMSCCFTYATTVKSFKLGFKKEQFSGDPDARIVVTASDGSKSKSYPVLADIDNITVSGNDFGKGIISISLFVNSKFMNSINYNNQ